MCQFFISIFPLLCMPPHLAAAVKPQLWAAGAILWQCVFTCVSMNPKVHHAKQQVKVFHKGMGILNIKNDTLKTKTRQNVIKEWRFRSIQDMFRAKIWWCYVSAVLICVCGFTLIQNVKINGHLTHVNLNISINMFPQMHRRVKRSWSDSSALVYVTTTNVCRRKKAAQFSVITCFLIPSLPPPFFVSLPRNAKWLRHSYNFIAMEFHNITSHFKRSKKKKKKTSVHPRKYCCCQHWKDKKYIY